MTVVDWIIAAILVFAALGGFMRGFFRSAFGLAGLVLGIAMGAWNYGRVAALLVKVVRSTQLADVIGFLLIALVVMFVVGLVGTILSNALHSVGLGCLDRIAGAAFGLFQGALLVTLLILVTVAFFPRTEWLTQSRLPRYFFGACHLSTNISPKELAIRVRQELKTLENKSPEWTHPGPGRL
jgi:membrane protein required for colicin V production